MKKQITFAGVFVLMAIGAMILLHSQQPPKQAAPMRINTEFTNPRRVVIQGYRGSAEEPFITPGGQHLIFDDRTGNNDPSPDIYYAKRVNDITFTFIGKVQGANTSYNEASANMDDSGNFYFISNRSYGPAGDLNTVFCGIFKDGSVTGVASVQGVSDGIMGWVDMDAQISPDGRTLYVSDGDHTHGFPPRSALIKMFTKNTDGSFTKVNNSAELLKNVNAGNFSYAPQISRDGLELFFVRLNFAERSASIYIAKRSSTSEPFGIPQLVAAADGFVESAFLSRDENHLYYHKSLGNNGTYGIYMLTRQK